jgi:hypothetical protein
MTSMPAEHNAILEKFALFGVNATNAMESQALIELKSQYCEFRRCMQCAVGTYCLKY